MGLTVHYRFKLPGKVDQARNVVESLHRRAKELEFETRDVVEFVGDDARFDQGEDPRDDAWFLKLSGGYTLITGKGEPAISLDPSHLIGFLCWPGITEPSAMGLCRYPATATRIVDGREEIIETGFAGAFGWSSFCKTQYASNPTNGGVEHFLEAHVRLISLLDHAQSLGILDYVSDEGEYWEHRDREKLAAEVHQWNAMVAGFVGNLRDSMSPEAKARTRAPITDFPNFEHLEAEGRRDEESAEHPEE